MKKIAPIIPAIKNTLIVTIKMVICRPSRHIEFDLRLMFALPNPLTTVKCVELAIDNWSKSLAFSRFALIAVILSNKCLFRSPI